MSEIAVANWCRECGRRGPCQCKGRDHSHVQSVDRYDSLFRHYAYLVGLGWRRIKQQAIAESSLDPKAVSPVGAKGLMQFMPATWDEWGDSSDPFDPEASIRAGCRYMRFLFDRFGEIPDEDERYRFALAGYNAGRGNINKALQLARQSCGQPASFAVWDKEGRPPGPWQEWAFTSLFLHEITGTRNASETIGYVSKIMGVTT